MKLKKYLKVGLCSATMFAMLLGSDVSMSAAPQVEQLPSYRTVTEVFDWGAEVSKVIVNLGVEVKSGAIDKDTFKVYVRRVLAEGAVSPAEAMKMKGGNVTPDSESTSDSDLFGYRKITTAYVSDAEGNAVGSGQFVTIEMAVSPTDNLGRALNFNLINLYHNYVTSIYTIEQVKPVGKLKGIVIDNYKGNIRPIVDKFKFGHKMINNLPLGYASYEPQDNKTHPLIIWLHGLGEGGSDSPALPIMANKADMFADESLQKYFNGAYVLVPQAPTYWMHGYKSLGDGTSIYEDTLMSLIKAYVSEHNIDKRRIYLGGNSNGGYMTMLLVRDYPDYFAAAFPTCEALRNDLISDADIQKLSKTPLWFIAAKTDDEIPPYEHVVPTVERLRRVGANVHFSFFDDVHDMSGLYKQPDGRAYEYPGHSSWIYVYNDDVEELINGQRVKLMEWLAKQKR